MSFPREAEQTVGTTKTTKAERVQPSPALKGDHIEGASLSLGISLNTNRDLINFFHDLEEIFNSTSQPKRDDRRPQQSYVCILFKVWHVAAKKATDLCR